MIKNTKIVGILNITPDSFSDGNKYNDVEAILSYAEKLIKDGADVIDIGAESTRPGATKLSAEQEWQRLSSVLKKIIDTCNKNHVETSIDTYHLETAKKAIEMGIDYINDVSGFKNPQMIEVAKNSSVKIIVMHSLTVPADKTVNIDEGVDAVSEVLNWGNEQIKNLVDNNIDRSRIIFDPGIGFNKTASQSKELIQRVEELRSLRVPIYIGHSRKSFLGDFDDKDKATIEISKQLIAKDIDYIRVHDVSGHGKTEL
ncbi:MAG: dihydropteroate synthase [Rickettsiales bacterium]|nr:dihydropteroate synthase [Pseudomonadota bacterium]MDA0965979.1 dihydropteroate synthase [Pseudomonadota bacterium]MDG4542550.1 dihydropteroate synthase [Rickettsiales bacterium]MDG4545054.1 dihydropteroate synthase [Rickettsiales bacterium]MDG4547177.1 dihydropteroate synthase [Rickettsiales bacterium]